jgi:predicted transcriptional regulator
MSSLSLRLPDSLHQKLRELAEREDVSINQFIATAVAEKTAAVLTLDYLEQRAARADRRVLDRLLRRAPDVPPMTSDELPEGAGGSNKRLQPTKGQPRRKSRSTGGARSRLRG